MEADLDRDRGQSSVPVSSPLGGCLALWLVAVVFIGALVYSGQLRQAREEFEARAGAVHREVEAKLKANEIILDGVAAFLRAAGPQDERALQAYSEQVLDQFPQIYQVGLQRRVSREELPRLALELQGRGISSFEVRSFDFDRGRWQPPAEKGVYLVTVAMGGRGAAEPVLGFDVDAVDFLRDAVARALERERPAASRMFQLDGGRTGYVLFRPVYASGDSRYDQLLVSLLVRVDELLPERAVLAPKLNVRLQHGYYAGSASQAWVVAGHGTASGLERLLFPRLQALRVFGSDAQPFVLSVDRQLGWEILDPKVASAFAMSAGLGLLAAISYGRSRARREDERRRSEQKLYRLANFDSLTGLPNRNLFLDRLQQALSRGRRHGTGVGLFFLDLDGFKAVNDSAGHAAGDRLLQLVAGRLLGTVREQDTVARLSGDEFVIVLEDIKSREDVDRVLDQLHECFIESFCIDGFEFMLTASIGLATYPEDGDGAEQLLRRADQKMYANKFPEWAAPTDSG